VMEDDARRRASFGITIENSTTRVWFCCRSAIFVSEAFDFINVRLFFFKNSTLNHHEWIPDMFRWNTIRSPKN
jgi:hypothetical protein